MAVSLPTGYADAYGNVWVFGDGLTVVNGETVRGSLRPGQRRLLAPGEQYVNTHGWRCVVPDPPRRSGLGDALREQGYAARPRPTDDYGVEQ